MVMTSENDLGPQAEFDVFLALGRFMLQRSLSTGRYTFYPRTHIASSGERDLEWVEASGDATVYSVTTIPRRAERGADYNVAIVELAEGPRLMSTVVGIESAAVFIDMPLMALIEPASLTGAKPRVVFTPLQVAVKSAEGL